MLRGAPGRGHRPDELRAAGRVKPLLGPLLGIEIRDTTIKILRAPSISAKNAHRIIVKPGINAR